MNYLNAFWVGGLICVLGQILIDKTKLQPARILVLFVCLGCVFGVIGWYKPLVEFASCGATVPITGFGYNLAKGVMEAVDKRGLIGVLTGGLSAASGGITSAVVFSAIASLVFKPKTK